MFSSVERLMFSSVERLMPSSVERLMFSSVERFSVLLSNVQSCLVSLNIGPC